MMENTREAWYNLLNCTFSFWRFGLICPTTVMLAGFHERVSWWRSRQKLSDTGCPGCQSAGCFQGKLDVQIHRWGWLHSPTQIKESGSLDVRFSIAPLDQLQLCHTQKNGVKRWLQLPTRCFFCFCWGFQSSSPLQSYNPNLPVLQHDSSSR